MPALNSKIRNLRTSRRLSVGRTGLRETSDVKFFLKSKSGQSLIAQIINLVAQKKASLEQFIRFQIELLQQRMAQERKWADTTDKSKDESKRAWHNYFVQLFKLAVERIRAQANPEISTDLQAKTNSTLKLEDMIEQRSKNLDELEKRFEPKYEDFDKELADLDQFYSETIGHDPTTGEKNPATLNDEEKTKALSEINARITQYQTEADKEFETINTLVEQGRDQEAMVRQDKLCSKYLQIAGLVDLQDVIEKRKILYDEEGNVTNKLSKAHFIVPEDKKIVKVDKTWLLCDKNDDLSSPETRAKAAQAFNKQLPSMSNLKNVVASNKALERNFLNTQLTQLRTDKAILAQAKVPVTRAQTISSTDKQQNNQNSNLGL